MLGLEGSEVVIIGIQPEVAFAMARLGLRLEEVPTALDFDEGTALLKARLKERRNHA
jgi:rsbT antagonist protein RsbS